MIWLNGFAQQIQERKQGPLHRVRPRSEESEPLPPQIVVDARKPLLFNLKIRISEDMGISGGQARLEDPQPVMHRHCMIYLFHNTRDILIVESRPIESDTAREARDAEFAHGVEEAHKLNWCFDVITGLLSERFHLRRFRRVDVVRAAVDPVDFLTQHLGLHFVNGSVEVEARFDNPAVVNHSRNAADSVCPSTEPKHPNLML